ncbi:MAG: RHS repeat-associated core domain-containing protein [Bacteriovoracaceae bacterium]
MIAIKVPQNFLLSPECTKFSAALYIVNFVNSFISEKSQSDDVENIVQHYVYSSFGKILKVMNGSVDNTANPLIKTNFAYTNREYDSESGLYYYRARYYDASSGRFLQEDLRLMMLDPLIADQKIFIEVTPNL